MGMNFWAYDWGGYIRATLIDKKLGYLCGFSFA